VVAVVPRVGQLVNKAGGVYLVGDNGLYAFANLAAFNSWSYSFAQIFPANTAEVALSQVGIVPVRKDGCSNLFDQIKGVCGNTVTPVGPTSMQAFVSHLYSCVLQRNGSDAEVNGWSVMFTSNKSTVSAMYTTFFTSAEYKLRNSSDKDYATSLYKCILFRTPTDAEASFQAGALGFLTRNALRMNFLRSAEFQLSMQSNLNFLSSYGVE